eukprot:scaffold2707_cov417-Prasinococcus_capsulatus_cf.AAC.13
MQRCSAYLRPLKCGSDLTSAKFIGGGGDSSPRPGSGPGSITILESLSCAILVPSLVPYRGCKRLVAKEARTNHVEEARATLDGELEDGERLRDSTEQVVRRIQEGVAARYHKN